MNNIVTINGKKYNAIRVLNSKCDGCVFQTRKFHIGCSVKDATEECIKYTGRDSIYYIFVDLLTIKKLKIL